MKKERTKDTVEDLTKAIVIRVLDVYRDEYVEHCLKHEPESLLGLVKRLQLQLGANGKNSHVRERRLTPMPERRKRGASIPKKSSAYRS